MAPLPHPPLDPLVYVLPPHVTGQRAGAPSLLLSEDSFLLYNSCFLRTALSGLPPPPRDQLLVSPDQLLGPPSLTFGGIWVPPNQFSGLPSDIIWASLQDHTLECPSLARGETVPTASSPWISPSLAAFDAVHPSIPFVQREPRTRTRETAQWKRKFL